MKPNRYVLELFLLKCAAIKSAVDPIVAANSDHGITHVETNFQYSLKNYINQIDLPIRQSAARMAEYYKIFYMIENFVRAFIVEALDDAVGPDWWSKNVPAVVQDSAQKARERELNMAFSPRSSSLIEYTNFGDLFEIIKFNNAVFSGLFPSMKGLERVMANLNALRGPIMHCGNLSEDEVKRLEVAVRDWFNQFSSPTSN